MATVIVTKVERMPGTDVAIVTGTIDGVTAHARGWVSATANYYPPASYNADGTLKAGAVPRAMTNAEKLAYAKQVLQEQNQTNPDVPAPALIDLGIAG